MQTNGSDCQRMLSCLFHAKEMRTLVTHTEQFRAGVSVDVFLY